MSPALQRSLLVACGLYLLLAAILGAWIIDDAGISTAYARNIASGAGLVSQPGRPPVEGFSNFLWVLLLYPLALLRLLDPVVVPKLVGAVTVLLALAQLARTLRHEPGVGAALLLAASAPPLVVWSVSGLENGLFFLLAMLLLATLAAQRLHWPLLAGTLVAGMAMTHPEGPCYLLAPVLLLLAQAPSRGGRETRRSLGLLLGAFTLIFGLFLAFRLSVFGLPLPHTWYAKRVLPSMAARLMQLGNEPGQIALRLWDLALGTAGPLGVALLLAGPLGLGLAWRRGEPVRVLALVLSLVLAGAVAWVLLDADWMGEYRFATVPVALGLVAGVLGLAVLLRAVPSPWRQGLGALVVVVTVLLAGVRVVRFAQAPPTSLATVERVAARFDAYADVLRLPRASILTADIGGTLLQSRLTVYDAAGLCEPDVVHTLKEDTPIWLARHPRFFDWVFGTIKPTFIHLHDFWTFVTALEDDPRFLHDYVAINAYDDTYVRLTYGRTLHSGDFVRRDVLPRGGLERLQAMIPPPPPGRPWVRRLPDALRAWVLPAEGAAELKARALALINANRELDQAATLLARAHALAPADVDVAWSLAWVLDQRLRSDEARVVWGDILELALRFGDELRARLARTRLDGPLPSSRPAPQVRTETRQPLQRLARSAGDIEQQGVQQHLEAEDGREHRDHDGARRRQGHRAVRLDPQQGAVDDAKREQGQPDQHQQGHCVEIVDQISLAKAPQRGTQVQQRKLQQGLGDAQVTAGIAVARRHRHIFDDRTRHRRHDQHRRLEEETRMQVARIDAAEQIGVDRGVAVVRIEDVPRPRGQLGDKGQHRIAEHAQGRHVGDHRLAVEAVSLGVVSAPGADRLEQTRQLRRIHLQVGVHLDQDVGAQLQRRTVAADHRRTNAAVDLVAQQHDAGVGRFPHGGGRGILAGVVDHDDAAHPGRNARQHRGDGSLGLVGRNDDANVRGWRAQVPAHGDAVFHLLAHDLNLAPGELP